MICVIEKRIQSTVRRLIGKRKLQSTSTEDKQDGKVHQIQVRFQRPTQACHGRFNFKSMETAQFKQSTHYPHPQSPLFTRTLVLKEENPCTALTPQQRRPPGIACSISTQIASATTTQNRIQEMKGPGKAVDACTMAIDLDLTVPQ
jgi:hypothetical protein